MLLFKIFAIIIVNYDYLRIRFMHRIIVYDKFIVKENNLRYKKFFNQNIDRIRTYLRSNFS